MDPDKRLKPSASTESIISCQLELFVNHLRKERDYWVSECTWDDVLWFVMCSVSLTERRTILHYSSFGLRGDLISCYFLSTLNSWFFVRTLNIPKVPLPLNSIFVCFFICHKLRNLSNYLISDCTWMKYCSLLNKQLNPENWSTFYSWKLDYKCQDQSVILCIYTVTQ